MGAWPYWLLLCVAVLSVAFWVPRQPYQPQALDHVSMHCFEETQPIAWSWCLNEVTTSDNPNVIYYFHGRNGNERWWNDRHYHTGKLYQAWEQAGLSPPTVVSVSFGKVWVLNEDHNAAHGGLYPVFESVVIPAIEARLKHRPGQRMVAGISMGGFNALITAFKTRDFFTKAASLCAPLATVSHHDDVAALLAYINHSGISLKRAIMLWFFSRRFYPDKTVWQQSDPVVLSRSFSAAAAPSLYVSCGAEDDWGCLYGSEILVQQVRQRGGDIQWLPRKGGHCDIDYRSLASFLH